MGGNVMRMCFFPPQDIKNEIEFLFILLRHHLYFNIHHAIHHFEKSKKMCDQEFFFSFRTKNRFEAQGARCSVFSVHPLFVLNYAIT